MTKDEITLGVSSIFRHLMTVGAGILAAQGLAGSDQLASIGGSIAVFAATLGWSFIEKNATLKQLCDNAPVSELESLCKTIAQFRSQGANPMLLAHLAQAVTAIANQELMVAHPELAPPATGPTAQAPAASSAAGVVPPIPGTVQ